MQKVQKSVFARWSTAKIAMLRYAIAIMSAKTHLGYWVPVNVWDDMQCELEELRSLKVGER